jgi:HlyD family secretion protein
LASQQNLDELTTQVQVLRSKYAEASSRLSALESQRDQIRSGQRLVDIQLADTRVMAPRPGTVLTRYVEAGETVGPGQPIVELADLKTMIIRTYVPLSLLSKIKLSGVATIKIDGIKDAVTGNILTVANQAEFTPKVVYTKETKQSLVYAVRIRVDNSNGALKIGMPVDVRFN